MRFKRIKKWARAGMLAGLFLAGPSMGLAQHSDPNAPPVLPPTTIAIAAGPKAPEVIAPPVGAKGIAPAPAPGEAIVLMPEEGKPDGGCPQAAPGKGDGGFDWTKVPFIEAFPRPGNFFVPPTGPGYYSLLDLITGNYRENPPKYPYFPFAIKANSSFNYDFRYLDDPNNTQHDWLDCTKRIHLGDDWMFSIGGEERWRYMHEVNSRLTGTENNYDLTRTRLWTDLCYQDKIRVFAEFIDARTYWENLPPLLIDQDHADILNLFIDVKLFTLDNTPAYFRVGRQELLYGSERLISPLDWANTRRTFQGIKGFWHSKDVDVDLFWVQPVIVNPTRFDSVDNHQGFAGLWTTYRPAKGQSLDLYYLYLDNTNLVASGETVGRRTPTAGYNASTVGSRYSGDYQHFLFDFEGMYQFGDWSNQNISAAAYTTGLGYDFAKLPLNPQFWVYYDFASGDHNPGTTNVHGTFNQLFPFGHYYFGFLDLVGRQNINDVNFHFACYPAKWITFDAQLHMFRLDSAKDALYSAGGLVLRRDPTGAAGTDVGNELDLFANFHLTQHQDVLVGWSKLYEGAFIRATAKNGAQAISPELFYVMWNYEW